MLDMKNMYHDVERANCSIMQPVGAVSCLLPAVAVASSCEAPAYREKSALIHGRTAITLAPANDHGQSAGDSQWLKIKFATFGPFQRWRFAT